MGRATCFVDIKGHVLYAKGCSAERAMCCHYLEKTQGNTARGIYAFVHLRTHLLFPVIATHYKTTSQHHTPPPIQTHTKAQTPRPGSRATAFQSNEMREGGEVSTTRHQTAGYATLALTRTLVRLTLEQRILNLVECVALLFLIFTDLASRLSSDKKQHPTQTNGQRDTEKKRQADETERMCIHSGGDMRFNMMTSPHDLKIHTRKREGSRASTQAIRSTTEHQICMPSPKIKIKDMVYNKAEGGLQVWGEHRTSK